MDSELSVAIKGTDTLSPALNAVNERLARSRAALNASGAVASQFAEKLAVLQGQYATGEKGAIQYERELAKLERQFKMTSEAVTAFNTQSAAGVGTYNQVVTHTDRMTHGLTKAAFGIQNLSLAFEGGRISSQGLINSMTMLGIGSPEFLVITAGLSVIGTLILQMGDNAGQSAEQIEAAANRMRTAVGSVTNVPALRRRLRELDDQEAGIVAGQRFPTLAHALTPAEATERDEIRRRLRDLERRTVPTTSEIARQRQDDFSRGIGRFTGGGKPTDIKPPEEVFGRFAAEPGKAFGPLRDELKNLKGDLKEVAHSALDLGDAFTAGFGAVIDAGIHGGNVLKALTGAVLGELSREARAKAIFEAAEGFASLFNLAKGGPAGAAAHFKAAALYGAVAVGAGAAAGGGGGGGASRGAGSATGTAASGGGSTYVIQIVAADSGRILREQVVDQARFLARGGSVPGTSTAAVIPIAGAQLIVSRGFR